jgi:hypothetical protein
MSTVGTELLSIGTEMVMSLDEERKEIISFD